MSENNLEFGTQSESTKNCDKCIINDCLCPTDSEHVYWDDAFSEWAYGCPYIINGKQFSLACTHKKAKPEKGYRESRCMGSEEDCPRIAEFHEHLKKDCYINNLLNKLQTLQEQNKQYEEALKKIKNIEKPCKSHCVECNMCNLETLDCYYNTAADITVKALEG